MKTSYTIAVVIIIILFPNCLISQVLPAEGSSLHYRLIGFSFPNAEHASKYRLEIADGNYHSEDSFHEHIVDIYGCNKNKIIAEVPSFGKNYTWRVVYLNNNTTILKSGFYHFNTRMSPYADTSLFRLAIKDTAKRYKGDYVFVDDNKTLYDMNGHPVWYVPDIGGISITPRDLKISPQGTITFLYDPLFEINYNGNVLWKAPKNGHVSGESTEHFNHEFTRLSNGHYMALGEDSAIFTRRSSWPTGNDIKSEKSNEYDSVHGKKTQFGTLIEYDGNGNVVWSWRSSDYFTKSDLVFFTPPQGQDYIDVHVNSFYFDEKHNNIYVSFKNISRIVKVKYPEGIVISEYGESYQPGGNETGAGLFCGQHACKYSDNGYLYLYNNNSCDSTGIPKILVLEEPNAGHKDLRKIWEYECAFDDLKKMGRNIIDFKSGGNVVELPDQSIFVCMTSAIYNKLFIVDRDKEILWSAMVEKWNSGDKKWQAAYQYRASIITREDIERLIWGGVPEKDNSFILESK